MYTPFKNQPDMSFHFSKQEKYFFHKKKKSFHDIFTRKIRAGSWWGGG